MREYFGRLSSLERRFVVGVMLIIFVLLNWIFVRPLFYDWAKYQARRQKAADTLRKFEDIIATSEKYKPLVAKMEGEGMAVPAEDQTVNFIQVVQQQASGSGLGPLSVNRMPDKTTNQFFVERALSVSATAGEGELVDFLFNLGAGNSLIRVRGLSLHPDPPRFKLAANATLVASYQKKAAPRPAAPAKPTSAKPASEPPATAGSPTTAGSPKPTEADKPKPVPVPAPAPTPASQAAQPAEPPKAAETTRPKSMPAGRPTPPAGATNAPSATGATKPSKTTIE